MVSLSKLFFRRNHESILFGEDAGFKAPRTKDVTILQDHGIIGSNPSNPERVAILFNELTKVGFLRYEDYYLLKLFTVLKRFSSTNRNR